MPTPVERANVFYSAIAELIRKDITKIRNTDKNKPLALRLAENAIFYFKDNNSLLKELAISYMHSHKWPNAVKTFESVKKNHNQLFDIYDYHRLLESYEMSEKFDKYESLLLEGITQSCKPLLPIGTLSFMAVITKA